jgi:hypothetical protein
MLWILDFQKLNNPLVLFWRIAFQVVRIGSLATLLTVEAVMFI